MSDPRVRVVMMCRDEGPMLVRWFSHYSSLFGWENLTVFDNGSTDPETLEMLDRAKREGSVIRQHYNTRWDFDHKGEVFAEVIRAWDAEGGYDFALPVDCDELLAVFGDLGVMTDRDEVLAEFSQLKGTREAMQIDMSLFNVPGRDCWFCPDRHFVKSFLSAGTIESLDNGHHCAQSALAPGYRHTRFTYLHYHNKALAVTRAAAIRKLAPRVDLKDPVALANHYEFSLAGGHLIPLLTMTEDEYARRYDDQVQVYVPASQLPHAPQSFVRLPDGRWMMWFAAKYLQQHPDVAENYESGPLHHYLRHGYNEGRAL